MKDVAAFVHRYLRSVALSGCARFSRTGLGNRVEIIAHRGASHAAPENTLASVSLAWQMEADAVEVDVHLSNLRRKLQKLAPELRFIHTVRGVGFRLSTDLLRAEVDGENRKLVSA